MIKELGRDEIVYNFDVENIKLSQNRDYMPEYREVYKKIKTSIEIDAEGYNDYLIDDFEKDKLNNIIKFIEKTLESKGKPMDICYLTYEEEKYPKPLYLQNGYGNKLKGQLENLQEAYRDTIYDFYNSSVNEEKENLLDYIGERRKELLNELINSAKKEGFEIRSSTSGFTFIPLKNDKVMTEEEYDELDQNKKEEIINKVNELKERTKVILQKLKDIEEKEIDKIKILLKNYLDSKIKKHIDEYLEELKGNDEAVEYLEYVSNKILSELIENYTSNYDQDEGKISESIDKYKINVILDNSEIEKPQVIYEEDPTVNNLIGNIEFENNNGVYTTDISLIKGGSILKANEGCLIIRMSNLLNNPLSYYYLKKAILTEKVDYNYTKGYLELLSLSSLKPQPIKIKQKVILIGDYRTYELLYNYDEDFRKLFKIRAECNPVVDIDSKIKKTLVSDIVYLCKEKKFKPLTNAAVKEVGKFLSRKAGNKNKIYYDNYEICNLLTLANNKVRETGKHNIDAEDIIEIAYPKEIIEKEILQNYKYKKILINVKEKNIGEVNGLSVIDVGYMRMGKPIRITCLCYKGNGAIIDIQKENKLSGSIHSKSISILKGVMNYLIGGYNNIPVDFHLSFEQIYGLIDGDSASVAEVICMISSLSKIPIKQNIAVTGSINQFGEVQPIGGVNEKIEGFYKICKIMDDVKGKGVLIPESNKNDLVLNEELEREISKGNFKIYTMKNINDAIEVLMGDDVNTVDEIMSQMKKEARKYSGKKGKSS